MPCKKAVLTYCSQFHLVPCVCGCLDVRAFGFMARYGLPVLSEKIGKPQDQFSRDLLSKKLSSPNFGFLLSTWQHFQLT